MTSVIDALNGTGGQTFDADGNRDTMTDPNLNQTHFHFDLAGRFRGETSEAGSTVSLDYNPRNLIEKVTNGRGQAISYTYYGTGRVETSTGPEGTISYTYDQNGNLKTVTGGSGTITREYDPLNRVEKYTDARGNTIRYSYDKAGNLQTLTYPDLRQVTYQYSPANLLKSVTDWAGRITTYGYDKNGRMITTTRPDGTVLSCGYDDAGQLRQMKDVDAQGNVISQHDFTYDSAGNVETEQVLPNPGAFTLPRHRRRLHLRQQGSILQRSVS